MVGKINSSHIKCTIIVHVLLHQKGIQYCARCVEYAVWTYISLIDPGKCRANEVDLFEFFFFVVKGLSCVCAF